MFTFNKPLTGNIEHICAGDPAIDQEDEGLEESLRLYTETGDESHLPIKGEPTRFVLRRLHGLAQAHIRELIAKQSGTSLSFDILVELVKLSLIDIKNLKDADGSQVKVQMEHNEDFNMRICTVNTLDQLYDMEPSIIPELGYRAFVGAFLADPLSKASE